MPASAAAQQPVPVPTQVRDSLAQRGYDVSGFTSDEDLLSAIEQGQAIADQHRMVEPHLREFMSQRDEYYRWREQQRAAGQQPGQPGQQPQSPQGQPAAKKKAWELPEYDENWKQYVKWDDARGEYVPRDQYSSPAAAEKLNAYARALQKQQQDFWQNPHEKVWEGLEDRVQQQVNAGIQQFMQQQTAAQQAASYINQHKAELYVTDPQGQIQADHAGNPLLRPKGQALWSYIEHLRQAGVTDVLQRNQLAIQMVEADELRQQIAQMQQMQQQLPQPGQPLVPGQQPAYQSPVQNAPQPISAPPIKQQQEQTFIQRALQGQGHMPNRAGSVVAASQSGAPQNPEDDFETMALSRLAQANGHVR